MVDISRFFDGVRFYGKDVSDGLLKSQNNVETQIDIGDVQSYQDRIIPYLDTTFDKIVRLGLLKIIHDHGVKHYAITRIETDSKENDFVPNGVLATAEECFSYIQQMEAVYTATIAGFEKISGGLAH